MVPGGLYPSGESRTYDDGRPTFEKCLNYTSIPLSALIEAPVYRSVR